MLPPISNPNVSPDSATQETSMHRIFSIPEMREAIEKRLDRKSRRAYFDALTTPTTPTGERKALNFRALKLHLVDAKVLPKDQQELFGAKDDPLQKLLLQELEALAASNKFRPIIKNVTLLKCLTQFGNPETLRFLKQSIEQNPKVKEGLLSLVKSSQTEAGRSMAVRTLVRLNERIKQEPGLKGKIEQSPKLREELLDLRRKAQPQGGPSVAAERSVLAARVLTLLVKAGVDLSGQDFSGIKVPGVNLCDGKLTGAKFIGADLSNVDFQGAQLRAVNLQGANLEGVNFGELPSLELGQLPRGLGSSPSLCYSPDGRWLAVKKTCGNEVNLYDSETLELKSTFRLPDPNQASDFRVGVLKFSPDSKILAFSENERRVCLLSVESGEILHTFTPNGFASLAISFSPNNKILASVDNYNAVKLWNVESGEVQDTFSELSHVNAIDFSPDSRFLATGGGRLVLWDLENKEAKPVLREDNKSIATLCFSPDGKNLVSGHPDGTVTLWSVSDGKELYTINGSHKHGVHSVMFSPDGTFLVTTGYNELIIRDIDNGKNIHTLNVKGAIVHLSFSPDGKILAMKGTEDKTDKINLWKVDEGSLYRNSSREALDVTGMSIQDVQGLSSMNERLLKQRGASDKPVAKNDV